MQFTGPFQNDKWGVSWLWFQVYSNCSTVVCNSFLHGVEISSTQKKFQLLEPVSNIFALYMVVKEEEVGPPFSERKQLIVLWMWCIQKLGFHLNHTKVLWYCVILTSKGLENY